METSIAESAPPGSIMDDVCDVAARGGGHSPHDPHFEGGFGKTRWCVDDSSDSDDSDDARRSRRTTTLIRVVIVAIAIVLILVIVFCVGSKNLSSRLGSDGWVLVTQDGCPHCEEQLEILGGAYPKRARCSGQGDLIESSAGEISLACKDVPGFPYWYNSDTGKTKVGCQQVKDLKAMLEPF
jgi:hypothetical protein